MDPNVPVHSISSMDEIIARSMADRRFSLDLLGVFAAAALLLAAIGIYGVMSYSFSQRTHEVGIRIALGAQRLDILRLALAEGMRVVLIGLASGLDRSSDNDAIFPGDALRYPAHRSNYLHLRIRDSCQRRAFGLLYSGPAHNPRRSSRRFARRMIHRVAANPPVPSRTMGAKRSGPCRFHTRVLVVCDLPLRSLSWIGWNAAYFLR